MAAITTCARGGGPGRGCGGGGCGGGCGSSGCWYCGFCCRALCCRALSGCCWPSSKLCVVLTNVLMTGTTGAGADATFALGVFLPPLDPGQKLSLICLGVFTSGLGASVTSLAPGS